jgi:hypothetical protein
MLRRVQALEAARAAPRSPFAQAYGSFDRFADECAAGIAAGRLDGEFALVLTALGRWETDGTWGLWSRQPNRVWDHGRA